VGSLFSAENLQAIYKQGKIGPRLLLITNRKLVTRFRLVPKSMTLDDLFNISTTVRDRRSVQIDHLYETAYCESNGHVTDDVT